MRHCEGAVGRRSGCIEMVRARMNLSLCRGQQGQSSELLGRRLFSFRMHEPQMGILACIDIRINCAEQEATP